MKKRILALLLASAMTLSLAACGQKEEPAASAPAASSPAASEPAPYSGRARSHSCLLRRRLPDRGC